MRRPPPRADETRELDNALATLERDGAALVTVEPLADLTLVQARRLRERWHDLPEALRIEAVHQMAASSGDDVRLNFERALLVALRDSHEDARRAAIEALWESESTTYLRDLLDLFEIEDDAGVRVRIAESLGRFAGLAIADAVDSELSDELERALIATALDDAHEAVRLAALAAAAYYRPIELEPAIAAAYDEGHDNARETAIIAMGRFGGNRWAARVTDALLVGDNDLRVQAARAAPYVEDRRIVHYLYEAAEDDDHDETQLAAIWALGEIGGPNVQSFLEALRDTTDGAVNEAAEAALENAALLEGLVDAAPVH